LQINNVILENNRSLMVGDGGRDDTA
jgi:hypothetical protein